MGGFQDTIVAIATPLGEAALSVVRLSGPDTLSIVRCVFRLGKRMLSEYQLKERYVHYGFIVDPETGDIQDEVTLIFYKAPRSYTTEDMAEIICHGGYVSPVKVLRACIKAGARQAEPGEFTKRAFIGGRVDLTEAEAVLDVIHATSERMHSVALRQLGGALKGRIRDLRDRLAEMLMLVEASVDFPEEEIEFLDPEELKKRLLQVAHDVENLLKEFERSRILRKGVPIAIVGKPNVGKSSLLNAILREERAIVTDIPGTTRDTIEEEITIKGYPFRIVDTAGIRSTDDPVEKIGVERSIMRLKEAALVLFVVDVSRPLEEEDTYIASLVKDRNHIVVLNKVDLPARVSQQDINALGLKGVRVSVSCKLHEGIDRLQDVIVDTLGLSRMRESEFLINERHYGALLRAKEAIGRCVDTLEVGLSNEFIAIDLKEAMNRLGEITGEVTTEDILNMIFERFCIGK